MSDLDHFEVRLSAALRYDADTSTYRFDPATVARTAIAAAPRRSIGIRLGTVAVFGRPTTRVAALLVVLAFVVALAAGAIAVGAALHPQKTQAPIPTARFSSTGALAASQGQAAVRLRDGRVLLVGGTVDGSAAWLWDPATGLFSETGRMSASRQWPVAALLPDGQVLVAGGDTVDSGGALTPLATAELFDPVAGTFRMTGTMTRRRGTCQCRSTEYDGGVLRPVFYGSIQRPSAVSLKDGRVFVVGGAPSPDSDAEIYDPQNGSFTKAGGPQWSDTQVYRTGCNANRIIAAALHDGRVLVKCIDSAWLYDPPTDTFSSAGVTVTDSVGAGFVLADDRVLFTGRGRDTSPGRVEIFDPSAGAFHAGADPTDPLTQSPGSIGVGLRDGRVAFIGGSVGYLFDPASESFERIVNGRPQAVTSATLLDDGRVLIVEATDPGSAAPQELLDLLP